MNTVKCKNCKHHKDHPNNIYLLECTHPNHPEQRMMSHEHDACCGFGEFLVKNATQRKTLKKIFSNPIPSNIPWKKIESLLEHVGCKISGRKGSKVRITNGQNLAIIDTPHPNWDTSQDTTKEIRKFLEKLGVTP